MFGLNKSRLKLAKYRTLKCLTFGLIPKFEKRYFDLLEQGKRIKQYNSLFPSSNCSFNKYAVIIAELSLFQCNVYRVNEKIIALKKMGFEVKLFSYISPTEPIFNELQLASLLIFFRVPYNEDIKNYYSEAKRLGLKIYYDIDDFVFDTKLYSEHLSLHGEFADNKRQTKSLIQGSFQYEKAFEQCDVFLGSTETICNIARKTKTDVFLVENYLNNDLIEVYSNLLNEKISFCKDRIVIFYGSGASSYKDDFLLCSAAVNDILKKYVNVYLFIIGDLDVSCFDETVLDRVIFVDKLNLKDYYSFISNLDINIAPLTSGVFSDSKSNIKYIEASVFSIPSICSPRAEFSKVITNGENGFLADSYAEWYQYLGKLIEDPVLRKKIGSAAKKNVLSRYNQSIHEDYLKKVISYELYCQNVKKILLVNIFYGTSSYGGATVVVEKLAECIKKFSNFVPIVFCLHIGDVGGRLVKYDWNNVTVYSYSVNDVTSNYSNKTVSEIFDKVLQVEKPDLVHAHSVQGMGLEIFEKCKKHNIPYVITLHDFWWSCPRQFMLDINKQYCGITKREPLVCYKRCSENISNNFHRIQMMNGVIKNAVRVFTPSKSFSKIIGSHFDFVKVDVNENGINKVNIKKKNNDDFCVNFGYVGGKENIKGYDTLTEAFKNVDFSKVKLHLTDNLTKLGGSYRFDKDFPKEGIVVYPYLTEKGMNDFYSKIDALIFPSKCDESFGLTVREAISRGVFVICSKCGGPVDSITDYQNGRIFDKGNSIELKKCIDYVVNNIEKIRCKDNWNYGKFKDFSEQSSELISVYKEILEENM